MALEKMGAFTFDHADQPDTPTLTPTQLKAGFDSRGEELKAAVNALVDALEAVTDNASGADNIGATEMDGWAGSTLQAILESAKTDVDAHKADYTLQVPYQGTVTNTGNAYVIATPDIAALTAGMAVSVKINADSTGAATLNWDGKGAKGIKKANGTDAVLKNGGIYTLRYDGTNFIVQGEGASGNATASDLLSGKAASTDAGDITGTMPNRGTFNLGLGVSVPAGYYSGGVTASGRRSATGNAGTVTKNGGSVVVSGLTFKPTQIILTQDNNSSFYSFSGLNPSGGWGVIANNATVGVNTPPTGGMFTISNWSSGVDSTNVLWLAIE